MLNPFKRLALLWLAIPAMGLALAREPALVTLDSADLAKAFGGLAGSFVLLDPQTETLTRYHPARAATAVLPASTFKIANTLIALDTGVASGLEFALPRDSARAPREDWWPDSWLQDHTLRTAFPHSVVWFYQEMARRIGPERMRAYLAQFDYGNGDIGGGIDTFWLTGDLRISPRQQVAFLRRFYEGRLGVAGRSTDLVKQLMVLEDTPAYRLSGKTGWAGLGEDGGPGTGWLVGFVENDSGVYYFATVVDIVTPADAARRMPITKAALRALGVLQER